MKENGFESRLEEYGLLLGACVSVMHMYEKYVEIPWAAWTPKNRKSCVVHWGLF